MVGIGARHEDTLIKQTLSKIEASGFRGNIKTHALFNTLPSHLRSQAVNIWQTSTTYGIREPKQFSGRSQNNVEIKYYKQDGTAVYGNVSENVTVPSGVKSVSRFQAEEQRREILQSEEVQQFKEQEVNRLLAEQQQLRQTKREVQQREIITKEVKQEDNFDIKPVNTIKQFDEFKRHGQGTQTTPPPKDQFNYNLRKRKPLTIKEEKAPSGFIPKLRRKLDIKEIQAIRSGSKTAKLFGGTSTALYPFRSGKSTGKVIKAAAIGVGSGIVLTGIGAASPVIAGGLMIGGGVAAGLGIKKIQDTSSQRADISPRAKQEFLFETGTKAGAGIGGAVLGSKIVSAGVPVIKAFKKKQFETKTFNSLQKDNTFSFKKEQIGIPDNIRSSQLQIKELNIKPPSATTGQNPLSLTTKGKDTIQFQLKDPFTVKQLIATPKTSQKITTGEQTQLISPVTRTSFFPSKENSFSQFKSISLFNVPKSISFSQSALRFGKNVLQTPLRVALGSQPQTPSGITQTRSTFKMFEGSTPSGLEFPKTNMFRNLPTHKPTSSITRFGSAILDTGAETKITPIQEIGTSDILKPNIKTEIEPMFKNKNILDDGIRLKDFTKPIQNIIPSQKQQPIQKRGSINITVPITTTKIIDDKFTTPPPPTPPPPPPPFTPPPRKDTSFLNFNIPIKRKTNFFKEDKKKKKLLFKPKFTPTVHAIFGQIENKGTVPKLFTGIEQRGILR